MFDTIFGLPVHALVVHAVVVLVPLCGLGVIICALSGTWYARLATPVLVLLTVSVPAAFVAEMSGHDLERRLPASDAIEHHAGLGSQAPWVVLLFWIVVLAWYLLERRHGRQGLSKTFLVISVIAAVGATGYLVLVGDSGARAAWEDVVSSTNP